MLRNKTVTSLLLGGALLAIPALAQNEDFHRSEASVQAFGSFLKSTTDQGVRQSGTNTGGVLASYRFLFNRYNGVELNYGYSLNTLNYQSDALSRGINSYSHEATAAYVFRYPLGKITPFALAGAGALVFDPKDVPGVEAQARPAFVYGGGADFSLTKRAFFRAGYRGLVYNSPNFSLPELNNDRLSHRAEPFGGFGFRF